MTGADTLISTSAAAGIEICFANAGTTEMAVVDAMARSGAIRAIPTLFEGVASGAADGYARMAGKPAAVLLHLGPGLGNATANLHNARRAPSPVVLWVGEHATWLLPHDPPLASDIASIARGISNWVRTIGRSEEIPALAEAAVRTAQGPSMGVSTLVLPADIMEAPYEAPDLSVWEPSSEAGVEHPKPTSAMQVVEALCRADRPLLLLGGAACDEEALMGGARIAQAVGARLLFEQFPRCARREPGLPSPERLGYLPFQAREQLRPHDLVVVLGADPPVCFFGYPGEDPLLTQPTTEVLDPVGGQGDVYEVLEQLMELLDAPEYRSPAKVECPRTPNLRGALEPGAVCQVLGASMPEDSIVVCEGITSSLPLYPALEGGVPHDFLTCKGGAIGFGIPAAIGAAVAAPGRRVISYVGDGSSLYTIQGLWTQARMQLDVTTIVLVNRSYAVLQFEVMRSGGVIEGANRDLTTLDNPNLDFVRIAEGFGVPARSVESLEALRGALVESFAMEGPSLIAVHLG